MEWIFEGIGTAIITLIIGLITGGLYKYCVNKNTVKQSQKAGDNSSQIQIGRDNNGKQTKSKSRR